MYLESVPLLAHSTLFGAINPPGYEVVRIHVHLGSTEILLLIKKNTLDLILTYSEHEPFFYLFFVPPNPVLVYVLLLLDDDGDEE